MSTHINSLHILVDKTLARVKLQKNKKTICGQRGQRGQGGQSGQRRTGQTSIESTKSTGSTFPEIAANGMLVLLTVACSLLDRQIASLEKSFVQEGGFTERLYKIRSQRRNRG